MSQQQEKKTAFPIKKINDRFSVLEYPYDYYLDEILAANAENIPQMIRAIRRVNHVRMPLSAKGGDFGCTTFCVKSPEGHPLFGRNFDYLNMPSLLLYCTPKKGYSSMGMANTMLTRKGGRRLFLAPYCVMDGINEKGLAIAILEINAKATGQRTGKPPVITPLIVRIILDTCADVEEAIRVFKSYDMHASLGYDYKYHLEDAEGNSAVIEYIDNELRVLRGVPYAMNFYTSPDGKCRREMGRTRELWVKEALEKSGGIMDPEEAMDLLEKCHLHYRHRRGYMITCPWSIVYDCAERSAILCTARQFETPYSISLDKKELQ